MCEDIVGVRRKIGVDLGGTDIKIGVVDENCNILDKWILPTPQNCSGIVVADTISAKCVEITKQYFVTGIGIGTPGTVIDNKVSAVNLNFESFKLGEIVEKNTGKITKIENDANCAALCESVVGASKGFSNSIMITLGTGVGGAIIINGKIYKGKGQAGEVGHSCFCYNGKPCSCGLYGCFEQYASTTAFVKIALEEIYEHPNSVLQKKYENMGFLNGHAIFDSINEGCVVAKKVLDRYTDILAAGIDGFINILDPEIIVISGGISNAGDVLLNPIRKKMKYKTPIVTAKFKNDAGIIGASLLI